MKHAEVWPFLTWQAAGQPSHTQNRDRQKDVRDYKGIYDCLCAPGKIADKCCKMVLARLPHVEPCKSSESSKPVKTMSSHIQQLKTNLGVTLLTGRFFNASKKSKDFMPKALNSIKFLYMDSASTIYDETSCLRIRVVAVRIRRRFDIVWAPVWPGVQAIGMPGPV